MIMKNWIAQNKWLLLGLAVIVVGGLLYHFKDKLLAAPGSDATGTGGDDQGSGGGDADDADGGESGGSLPDSVPAPKCTLTINKVQIVKGGQVTLTWTTENANEASLKIGTTSTPVSPAGSWKSGPLTEGNYTYTLEAIGAGGKTTCTVNLVVVADRAQIKYPTAHSPLRDKKVSGRPISELIKRM